MGYHFGGKIPDFFPSKAQFSHAIRPRTYVDNGPGQGLDDFRKWSENKELRKKLLRLAGQNQYHNA